jgi:uncharacterized surface protein with fasciclin (FAS1) repeats
MPADDDTFGDACKALGTTKMELKNLASLPDIIKNHVVKGKVRTARSGGTAALQTKASAETTNGPHCNPKLSLPLPPRLSLTQVTSADLSEGMEATSIGGGKLKFTLAGGAKVNGITIKKADVSASNGVIHVVSGVITL